MRSEALLASRYVSRHPDAAAGSLQGLNARDVGEFLEALPPAETDALIGHMAPDEAAAVLGTLPLPRQGGIFERIPAEVAAAIVRRLTLDERRAILGVLSSPRSRRLARALRFGEDTAGGIADRDPPTVTETSTAEVARKRLHRRGADLPYVYVIDRGNRLVGVVSRDQLGRARPDVPVSRIMQPEVRAVRALMRLDEVGAHPAWWDLDALPVVDAAGTLVGVVRHRAVRRRLGGAARSAARHTRANEAIALGTAYCDLLARAMVALTTTKSGAGRAGGEGVGP